MSVVTTNVPYYVVKPAKRFGVSHAKTLPGTALTRLYDAVGKTFTPSVGTTAGVSDFDNEPIFKDIRLCNVVNGNVTAYYGEPGFSRTPATGDVMVEIPRFYYNIVDTATTREYVICDQQLDGFLVSPRHAPHSGNAYGYDKIYVSAYLLNPSYRSVSGNAFVNSATRAATRTACKNRGTGYYPYDYATFWTIALLYIVEVANWNNRTGVGAGNGDPANTGGSDNLSWHSGRGSAGVKYRDIEAIWGYPNVWVDGINVNGLSVYICTNPALYADDTDANYVKLNYSLTGISGWQSALGLDSSIPWAQICIQATGSSTTYIPNYIWVGNVSTGWRVFFIGGGEATATSQVLFNGLLYSVSNQLSSFTNAHTSARLIYLK